MRSGFSRLAGSIAVLLAAACGGPAGVTPAGDASSRSATISIQPPAAVVVPGAATTFSAAVQGVDSQTVTWSVQEGSAGGTVDSRGVYTAPATPGTYHVVAVSSVEPSSSASAPVTVKAPGAGGPVIPSGTPVVGTAHSPSNLPISFWAPDIQSHFGVMDIVDPGATADLQYGFGNISTFGTPFFSIATDSFDVYYALPGDPTYTIVTSSGTPAPCPLDEGGDTRVRVPLGAHVFTTADDQHLSIVDVERNRIYAFYAEAGRAFGVSGDTFIAPYRGCDVLRGDDAAIAAQISAANRYGCSGGKCGLAGLGAGVPTGGNGDSNGNLTPHGIIMPEDFDDTGWTGEAVGTLHHALYCAVPNAIQDGYVWPTQDPMVGVAGRTLKNGQIIRLDPAYDVEGASAASWAKRVMRTMQRYGCIVSDIGAWGLKFSAQGNWAGLGPSRGPNPWSTAGGAPPEASDATGDGQTGLVHIPIPVSRLQAILPHGVAN
jgi:hypothetical protein